MCGQRWCHGTEPRGGETIKKITIIEPAAAAGKNKKRRVAAYCRVSSGSDEQLVSLEAQKEHYENYITANPDWEYAGLYYDEGITGTKKEVRPALMSMIRDCEDGKIDCIVTKSLSRFARNTTDCLELVRKLLDLGISVYFEKEKLDTGSMESELLLSIMSSLAESESVSISENSKWGIRHQFKAGTYKLRYAPFGYTVTDGQLSVNEEEAKWVRFIFAEMLAGKSTYKIAAALNEKKVPTRREGKWRPNTVRGIIQNEKYIGDCLFQKTYMDFRFKRHSNRGEREQFYVDDHHEPIVGREDFENANRILKQHARDKNLKSGDEKHTGRYPFTKKIVCGECGSPFKRKIEDSGAMKYPAWACREHLEHRENCSVKSVRETVLEDAFATMMNKLIFARQKIFPELLEGIRNQSQKVGDLQRLSLLEDALEDLTEKRRSLTSIMAKGYIDRAAYTRELTRLQAEESALAEERKKLTMELGGDLKMTEALNDIIKFTGKGEMLTGFDAELFERFVNYITVCSREEIVFHLKCGLRLRERIN